MKLHHNTDILPKVEREREWREKGMERGRKMKRERKRGGGRGDGRGFTEIFKNSHFLNRFNFAFLKFHINGINQCILFSFLRGFFGLI